jgi:hypothetical protein
LRRGVWTTAFAVRQGYRAKSTAAINRTIEMGKSSIVSQPNLSTPCLQISLMFRRHDLMSA